MNLAYPIIEALWELHPWMITHLAKISTIHQLSIHKKIYISIHGIIRIRLKSYSFYSKTCHCIVNNTGDTYNLLSVPSMLWFWDKMDHENPLTA